MDADKLRIARAAAKQLINYHLAYQLRILTDGGQSQEWKKAVLDEAADRLEKK